jgi:hypothetical protein
MRLWSISVLVLGVEGVVVGYVGVLVAGAAPDAAVGVMGTGTVVRGGGGGGGP